MDQPTDVSLRGSRIRSRGKLTFARILQPGMPLSLEKAHVALEAVAIKVMIDPTVMNRMIAANAMVPPTLPTALR